MDSWEIYSWIFGRYTHGSMGDILMDSWEIYSWINGRYTHGFMGDILMDFIATVDAKLTKKITNKYLQKVYVMTQNGSKQIT